MTIPQSDPFDEWVICELMGHVRLAGHLTEQVVAGGSFLRLDIHREEGPAVITQLIPPPPGGPVYRITITTESVARQIGSRGMPQPAARWELETSVPAHPRDMSAEELSDYADFDDDDEPDMEAVDG